MCAPAASLRAPVMLTSGKEHLPFTSGRHEGGRRRGRYFSFTCKRGWGWFNRVRLGSLFKFYSCKKCSPEVSSERCGVIGHPSSLRHAIVLVRLVVDHYAFLLALIHVDNFSALQHLSHLWQLWHHRVFQRQTPLFSQQFLRPHSMGSADQGRQGRH